MHPIDIIIEVIGSNIYRKGYTTTLTINWSISGPKSEKCNINRNLILMFIGRSESVLLRN